MKIILFLVFCVTLGSCATTIYVVRHAEKAPVEGNMSATDPDLSNAGQQRALALRDSMNSRNLSAIFATQFKRTQQTVQPAASQKNKAVTLYNTAASDSLILALSQQKGKTFLVSGHSNTVPAMLRKIGLSPSMQTIPENDFDNFFVVSIRWIFGKTIKLKELTYGTVSP